jgi:hypothetical protein
MMSNVLKFPKPHAYNEGWRAGLQYAADIAEELCICGGSKAFHRNMYELMAEIEACLDGNSYCVPRKHSGDRGGAA